MFDIKKLIQDLYSIETAILKFPAFRKLSSNVVHSILHFCVGFLIFLVLFFAIKFVISSLIALILVSLISVLVGAGKEMLDLKTGKGNFSILMALMTSLGGILPSVAAYFIM